MRGLLVIEPLYHQIVAGNKTQTRRSGGLDVINKSPDEWEETGSSIVHTKSGIGLESVDFCNYKMTQENVVCKPRYHVGEVMYLKEPLIIMGGGPVYKFDYNTGDPGRKIIKWRNKLFMPAKHARAFIKVTNIRCERLVDISEVDCIAEGIEVFNGLEGYYQVYDKNTDAHFTQDVKRSFFSLYRFANKIHGGSIGNLWVWVYECEYLPNFKIA